MILLKHQFNLEIMATKKPVKRKASPKAAEKTIVKQVLAQDIVQRLEIRSWRSEIQQNVRDGGTTWASSLFLTGVPADKASEVTLCRIGFFSDDRIIKPSYANKEIRIYYPYSAYQGLLLLIMQSKKLYAEFREKSNGEIDAYIFSGEQGPGGKKHKK